MGAANQWRQDLARTAQMESAARQDNQIEQQNDIKLQQLRQNLQQHMQLVHDIQALPQTMPVMDKLMASADAALRQGQLDTANKLISGLSLLDARAASVEQRKAQADERQAKAASEKLALGEQLLTGVTDEQSYRTALEQYRATAGDDKWYQYMKAQPYSPAVVKQAQGFLTKQRSQVQEQLDRERIEAMRSDTARKIKLAEAQIEHWKKEEEIQRERATKNEKAGGPTAVSKIQATKNANMYNAASDVAMGLEEIMKLPVAGMGTFADLAYSNEPSVTGSINKWLANKATNDEAHMYATRLAGLAVAATRIANSGDVPRMSQVEAEQRAIASLSGQSRRVYFDKINQAALKALNSLENTTPADEVQSELRDKQVARLQKIVEQTDKILSMKGKKAKAQAGPGNPPAGVAPDVWNAMTDSERAAWQK